jgi:sec-independent protein translocase protein TatC
VPEEKLVDDVEMTFTQHLAELRNRLFIAIITVVVVSGAAFPLMPHMLNWVEQRFLNGIQLHVFSPAEIIAVEIKLSLLAGVVIGMPVILFQLYAFVAPALDRRVRGRIGWYVIPSFVMSALGIAFCGFLILPFVLHALLSLTQQAGLVSTYQLEPTIGFVTVLLGIFAVMFQLPIVLSILASIGLVNAKMLADKWRHATVVICVLAGVAAPDGNPLTMGLLALPLLGLYIASIAVVRVTQPKIAPA